jgi:RNA polymerase sigma-70 factor (ECF subfamily)
LIQDGQTRRGREDEAVGALTTDLFEEARRGDRDAFEALVLASSNRLFAIASHVLRDPDLAEDALQAALIDMWDDLPSLRDPARFEAWSYRLVCHACYRIAKQERRRARLRSPQVALVRERDPAVDLADRDEIEHSFARLTPEHRTVLVLRYYLGLTIAEIAEALGISPGTVDSRLHYALRDMRAALGSEARAGLAWGRST